MYVKIMSDENIPDNDPRKSFRLLANVVSVFFNRAPEAPYPSDIPHVFCNFENGEAEAFEAHGNVYLMNDSGKTIEKFGVTPLSQDELKRPV